ncbi:MAG: large conductance mechanosensitive channel protein MscL [Clostridia bacterium]|nr:large conductance mechanosensitive channel protein MscL [Clostridia bacterium]
MIKEFKEFIMRGNVMDLAVGVIIGGAFTAIVNSLVGDVIGPVIGMICGGIDFSGISVTVGSAELLIGNFIQAVINFLLVALCVFILIKSVNKAAGLAKKKEEAPAEEAPAAPTQEELLTQIRDILSEKK